jgi:hypothetical protein
MATVDALVMGRHTYEKESIGRPLEVILKECVM